MAGENRKHLCAPPDEVDERGCACDGEEPLQGRRLRDGCLGFSRAQWMIVRVAVAFGAAATIGCTLGKGSPGLAKW